MSFYRSEGKVPAKHFLRFSDADGTFFHEELISSAGFNGPSSLLYRVNPPTRVLDIKQLGRVEPMPWAEEFRNHLFAVDRVESSGDYLAARSVLAYNEDLSFAVVKPDQRTDAFYRNGYCDELVLVIEGTGTLRSAFGSIEYGPLDYLYVPRGITVQWLYDEVPQSFVITESVDPIGVPARFRNSSGQMLERAPYHERDLRLPELQEPLSERGEYEILVKSGAQVTRCMVDSHPFDVVGWDGSLYPFALNMRSYEPITGMLHQMPDMYQVFETAGAAICNITPRRMEEHPDRAPAQANHLNLDYDEILYRILNEAPPPPPATEKPTWSSEPGMGTITLHRRSMPHGPKAGYENRPEPKRIDVFMFMLDTKKPLTVAANAQTADDPTYVQAWL